MEQVYIEVLVARKRNMAAAAGKVICGVLAAVFLLGSAFSFLFLLGAAVCGMLAYFLYLQEWIEYEYSYVSRELTIDKIMAKSRRKTVAVYLLDKIEAGGMENSAHLDSCRNRTWKTEDYSSRSGEPAFVLYYEGQHKIILDADNGLCKALHSAAPNKIFLN